jgi:hypothetical protein
MRLCRVAYRCGANPGPSDNASSGPGGNASSGCQGASHDGRLQRRDDQHEEVDVKVDTFVEERHVQEQVVEVEIGRQGQHRWHERRQQEQLRHAVALAQQLGASNRTELLRHLAKFNIIKNVSLILSTARWHASHCWHA